jgi:maltodextrin utilization protein YvdJ
MDENNINYLDQQIDFPIKRLERRRKLLPWWVIGFIWLFLLGFLLIPVGIIMGLLNYNFEISLLGLSTNQPISLIGMFLIFLF